MTTPLHQQSLDAVHRLDASLSRTPDAASDNMAASLAVLAKESGLQRVDHVVISQATDRLASGANVFVVQGALDDPAHRRAHMATADAVAAPQEQTLQRLAQLEQPGQAVAPPAVAVAAPTVAVPGIEVAPAPRQI